MHNIVLTLILFIFSIQSLANKVATISTAKAIVYSDSDLTSALGYIRQGKKIIIGERALKQGEVRTLVISGRVAYIHINDITIGDEITDARSGHKKVTEHDVDELFSGGESDLSKNNFLTISAGQTSLGPQWEELSSNYDDTIKAAFSIGVSIEHRPPTSKRNFFSFGINYSSLDQDSLTYKSTVVELGLGRSLYMTDILSLDLLGNLLFSGEVKFSDPNSESFNKGLFYGAALGGQIKLFPKSNWGLFTGAKYYYGKLTGLSNFEDPQGETTLSELSGPQIYAGISKKF